MQDIRINKLRNRLYIYFQNRIPAQVPVFVRKLEESCQALIPGFTCLAVIPLNGFECRSSRDFFIHTTDLISAYGAKKMVCVRVAGSAPCGRRAPLPASVHAGLPLIPAADFKEVEKLMRG
ncbi:MAG: hypothetical protein WAL90_19430 [Desulfobacterales bacterium]